MTTPDHRDEVIAVLAASEAALRDQVLALAERAVLAEVDRDALRLVAVQSLHLIHQLQCDVVDLRGRYHRALDDARGLRAQLLQVDDRRAA